MSGSYVYEFPGMRNVSLSSADAFVIVFALDDYATWEEVSRLRDMVHEAKDCAADGDTDGQQQQVCNSTDFCRPKSLNFESQNVKKKVSII